VIRRGWSPSEISYARTVGKKRTRVAKEHLRKRHVVCDRARLKVKDRLGPPEGRQFEELAYRRSILVR
jgi:hypothetical protein